MCIIRWLPRSSAIYRLRDPEGWSWGPAEHILAGIFDGIAGGNWQRAGNRKAPRPKPIPRPRRKDRRTSTGAVAVPVTDIRAEIERRRALYAVPEQSVPPLPDSIPPRRRMTGDMVRTARAMAGNGIDTDVIAAHLRVTVTAIERLVAGATYSHIA